MRFICLVPFLLLALSVIGQGRSKTDKHEVVSEIDGLNSWKAKDFRLKSVNRYSATTSKGVTIESSLPKGGGGKDPSGKKFGYRIFFYRVINETATPLELIVNFAGDSFAIPPTSDSYSKVFVLQDTMTLDKEILYSYGIKGLDSLSITSLSKPTVLQRTVNPKEESLFYIGVVFYTVSQDKSEHGNGAGEVVRTELVLKEQELFYRINLLDPALIPCGKIVFIN
jgi:hypothetical protein